MPRNSSDANATITTEQAETQDVALSKALATARERPDNSNAWDELEALAAEHDAPEPVAELYAQILAAELPGPVARRLGERATRFCEEWFADDAPQSQSVMMRVFERDPTDEAVFDRLTMGLTAQGRWPALLDVYARAVEATDSLERQIQLLDDAVRVAKDLAHDNDRAIAFLTRLVQLRPTDGALRAALERLLERAERWQDLIALWDDGADTLSADDAAKVRVQMATYWLDKLNNPPAALDVLRGVLDGRPRDQAAAELAERILTSDAAAVGTRRDALALLRRTFARGERPLDVARVLRSGTAFAVGDELEGLHRAAADVFTQQGVLDEALFELGRLFVLRPNDEKLEADLDALVRSLGAEERYVRMLVEAAEQASLPSRAAQLRLKAATLAHHPVGDVERAIVLCERVFFDDADKSLALDAGRALDALLEAKGRADARVRVLERLAVLDTDKERRREILGALAKLAGGRGDADRAVATWRRRLEADPSDREALNGLISLYDERGQHRELVEVLRSRAELLGDPASGPDLARIAHVQAELLRDLEAALATWSELARRAPETVDQAALEEQLDRSARREAERGGKVLSSLGDAYRTLVRNAPRAVYFYAQGLTADPSRAEARAGLTELLSDPAVRTKAADALALAYAATDEAELLLTLLPHRLEGAESAGIRAQLLRQAAQLEEYRLERPAWAFDHLCAALIEEPQNAAMDGDLFRLAELGRVYSALGEALSAAAAKLEPTSARAIQLRAMEGELWERRVGNIERAFLAYSTAARGRSVDPDLLAAVCRTAALLGRFGPASELLVNVAKGLDRAPDELLTELENHVPDEAHARALCETLEAEIEKHKLAAPLRRALITRVAEWREKKCGDLDAAERLLVSAAAAGSPHLETLRRLAALQRRAPGRALFDTLVAAAELSADDLDPGMEAAGIALDLLHDEGLARPVLERTVQSASSLILRAQRPAGTRSAVEVLGEASERLSHLLEGQGEHRALIGLYKEAAALPIAAEQAAAFATRAAEVAAQRLGDVELAVQLYVRVLDLSPENVAGLSALAELYRQLGKLEELLLVRRRELAITQQVSRRLELRLDIAQVMAEIEARGGLLGTLLENLRDAPGHELSLERLAALLRERGLLERLYEILAEQAAKLDALGDAARAADLWLRAARLADHELADAERALMAYQRMVALKPADEALDALARIRLTRDEPALALPWLERLLEQTPREQRTTVRQRLALAYLVAGRAQDGIDCLVLGIEEAPRSFELRDLLAARYREEGRFEELAVSLADTASIAADKAVMLAHAREAATLFCERLRQPERAVPMLEKVVEAEPDDRSLRCLLADGYLAAGRLAEAKTLLDTMVAAFGRRRSPERAELHLRLSRVAQAEGHTEEALSQLDQAAGMDRTHVGILRSLGELAHSAGQLERAERAYSALLMAVRRPGQTEPGEIGAGEVLYHLHCVARDLGQKDKAAELLEKSVQAAAQNETETKRLKELLLARGETELLIRVLEQRLAQVQEPALEAAVLCDLAEVLEEGLQKPEEALAARLRALAILPSNEALHEATLRVAKRSDQVQRYVETLIGLSDRARRKEDQGLIGELALRAGSIFEHVIEDFAKAEEQYKQVQPAAAGYIEAQFALARVASRLGHEEEEHAVLSRIVALPDDPAYTVGKRSARYRLIELQVERAAERETGLAALEALTLENPDFVRASAILFAACDADPNDMRAIEMLERIVRRSDEPKVLLDFLERHARADGANPALVREGAELAVKLKEYSRAEKLLRRAIELAERGEGLETAAWALVALGRSRRDRGDLKGALDWLSRAMEVSDSIASFELGLEIASLAAGKAKDPARAVQTYEALRERDPTDRRVWMPLLELYRASGDVLKVNTLVAATLDVLVDPAERNALRLDTARRLLAAAEDDAAAILLRQVLDEEPDHEEATMRLADIYERHGENEQLADLLSRKLESARERQSPSLIPLSLRMGGLLREARPEDALDIYREGLRLVPESPELMRAAIDSLDPEQNAGERAQYLDRYLAGPGRTDADALALAVWLLDHHTRSGDEAAFEHALACAYRISPGHVEIRTRLESWYRSRQDYANLVLFLEEEAKRADQAEQRVALLVEAAGVRLEQLKQPSEAAALLRKARETSPDDFELLKRAVHASAATGELGPALAEIDSALAGTNRTKQQRIELLLLRSEVATSAAMHDDAVASLDAAYAEVGAAVVEPLMRGLERARVAAQERNNVKRERELTLRLVGLFHQRGEGQAPIELLLGWVRRVPNDIEALRALLELLSAAQRWRDAVRVAEALIQKDSEDVLGRIADRLATAARQAGEPQLARAGVERALARDPNNARTIGILTDLYTEIGEKRGLAELMARTLPADAPIEKRFETLRKVGQLLLDAGDIDAAVGPLTQASELKPDDVATVTFIADVHIARKHFQEAQDLLEKAMGALKQRRSPELALLRHRMAKLSQAAGDAQARLEWLNAALDADMNNGEVASELAIVAQNMNQLEIALKALRAITMLKGDCPMSRAEAFYRQAVIVAHKGEPRRAVLWAKKAKQEDASFPGVDQLLAELGE